MTDLMEALESKEDNIFTVDNTEITLDGDYIASLKLAEGDHLIGAVFDNTERTTDVKKVILTIQKKAPVDPENPIIPDKPDKPSGGGGSGSGNGGTNGGNTNRPSVETPTNPDGSLNPDYKPSVPDSDGIWEGDDEDRIYIKPGGSKAEDEWIGSNDNWYYIDENNKLKSDWFLDKNTNSWYMLNREHDGSFGAAKFGWYFEKQDGKWYFMNPSSTSMLTGWQFINGKYYYLTLFNNGPTYLGDNINGWKYDSTRNDKPFGSMYVNELTPDGYAVDAAGAWAKQLYNHKKEQVSALF